jgi:hypothetical protein
MFDVPVAEVPAPTAAQTAQWKEVIGHSAGLPLVNPEMLFDARVIQYPNGGSDIILRVHAAVADAVSAERLCLEMVEILKSDHTLEFRFAACLGFCCYVLKIDATERRR